MGKGVKSSYLLHLNPEILNTIFKSKNLSIIKEAMCYYMIQMQNFTIEHIDNILNNEKISEEDDIEDIINCMIVEKNIDLFKVLISILDSDRFLLNIIKSLVKIKPSIVNIRDNIGTFPLLLTKNINHYEYFISQGSHYDVNYNNNGIWYFYFSYLNNIKFRDFLYGKYPSIPIKDVFDSISKMFLNDIDFIIDKVHLFEIDDYGNTLLHHVVDICYKHNNIDIIEKYLSENVPIIENYKGHSVFHVILKYDENKILNNLGKNIIKLLYNYHRTPDIIREKFVNYICLYNKDIYNEKFWIEESSYEYSTQIIKLEKIIENITYKDEITNLCPICYDNKTLLSVCSNSHGVCITCCKKIKICPLCRNNITLKISKIR